MAYQIEIASAVDGSTLDGYYILRTAEIRTGSNGKPFLCAEIADRSGSIECRVWNYPGPISAADAGKVVRLRGEFSEYHGTLQLTAGRIRLAEPDERYDLSALVPTAPIDPEAALAEVRALIDSIEDADYRAVAQTMLGRNWDAFRSIPAAKTIHHAFLGGLLMHTADMLRAADSLAALYARVVDRSLLLAGTLIHDFSKRDEFRFSELGLVTGYSVKGELLGHLVMGAQEVAQTARELGIPEEKSILLQHLVLSHHGDPAFGAAVVPMCAEAELLSCIDLIDSRMEIYAETLSSLPAGTFSPRIFSLEKKIYRHN